MANTASTLQPSPAGIARVYGRAWYIDRNGEIGYIRRARVELWEDAFIDTRVAISQTDDSGYYEFNVAMTGSKNVYAKIFCESYIVSVTYGIFDTVYSYETPTKVAFEGSTTDLGYYYAPSSELWWQAMDYATDEYLWILGEVNWVRSQVQIKYPKGEKPISYGDVIELPNINVQPWGRSDVLHEYAHCVLYALYGSFPPGSCPDTCQCPQGDHYFNSVADGGFAFNEGWAEFMQCAVDDKPSNAYLSNLGDVDGDGFTNYFATNIENNEYTVVISNKTYRFKWYHGRCPYKPPNPGCPSFNNNGNTVEGGVAGILWDIYDPLNDDQVSMGFYPIWYVLGTYKPENMIEFLDYWPYTGVERELCDVCLDHGIAVFDDLDFLFYDNTFLVAGDTAYCTDVLGAAKTSFGLAKGGVYENPEGRTERIITDTKKDTGNLITVGGPAVSPLADDFDKTFGISYQYNPGVSFQIRYHDKSIYLNLADYPRQDICIIFLGEDNSRSVMSVWGYGWQGTYTGSVFIGDPNNWSAYQKANMLMLRWVDYNGDGLVHKTEIHVESSVFLDRGFQPALYTETPPDQPVVGPDSFGSLHWLFYTNTFFVAGDTAYCTDVLGSAKIAFGLAKGGAYENPEGRTDKILTVTEHNTGNLIPVGGPAINPVADEFDGYFGITYNYIPGVSFEIFCEGRSIYLNLGQYPSQDICIVYLGMHNSRNVMLVWGYGWEGTYAGSMLIGDPTIWQSFSSCHMLMVRWRDYNGDGLVQMVEITVEQWK